jgi:putative transcriptional regulator
VSHVDVLLPEYALGTLPADAARAVDAHLAICPRCVAELAIVDEVYAQLAHALPAPPAPEALRARVLAGTTGRFDAFVARIAAIIDVAVDTVRGIAESIDDAAAWKVGPLGTGLIHLPSGPRIANAHCGFIKLPAGTAFPKHRHNGTEHVLILQGAYIDSTGRTLRPGDEEVMPAGSEHAFTVLPGIDLVHLVVLENGIEIEGLGAITL